MFMFYFYYYELFTCDRSNCVVALTFGYCQQLCLWRYSGFDCVRPQTDSTGRRSGVFSLTISVAMGEE